MDEQRFELDPKANEALS